MLETQFSPWPSYTAREIQAVSDVLRSNRVNYWTGEEAREFESEFATWCGADHAVALANGTLALDVAFKALGIGSGDEVIVTPRSFLASASSIVNASATPVFVDIDRDSQNITADTIAPAITEKTKAIVCVHLAGWPCEMDEIMALASKNNIFVVEDCAQAHGAKYKGRSVGTFGHIAAWSFCQDKIMTTGGEGGMVTTSESIYWKRMWSYKDHGKSWEAVYEREHPPGFRWLHESFGTNWRILEMQAAIGRVQLQLMTEWHERRIGNAGAIWDVASQLDGLRVPFIPDYIDHGVYKCYVFVEPKGLKSGWARDRVVHEIVENGVPCYHGSCPEIYLEKAFDNTGWRPKERLPIAKELGETSLMFLAHPTLSSSEIEKTCDVIRKVMTAAVR